MSGDKDKMNIVVTGGAKGIGAAVVKLFAGNGYNVVFSYNQSEDDAQKLLGLLKDLSVFGFKADLTKEEDAKALYDFSISKLGRIDVLVNNAGTCEYGLLPFVSRDKFDKTVADNLGTTFLTTRCFYDHFVSNKRGSIINIASVWGLVGSSCEAVYSSAKAGIIGFTKALAKELAPSNIRVNAVAPGIVRTDMISRFSEDEICKMEEDIPLGRIGETADVAWAVFFLASKMSSYIMGEVINVSGGFVI